MSTMNSRALESRPPENRKAWILILVTFRRDRSGRKERVHSKILGQNQCLAKYRARARRLGPPKRRRRKRTASSLSFEIGGKTTRRSIRFTISSRRYASCLFCDAKYSMDRFESLTTELYHREQRISTRDSTGYFFSPKSQLSCFLGRICSAISSPRLSRQAQEERI